MGEFTGKVALVTGAAAGIGHATALAFAHAGARLVLADRDEEAGAQLAADIIAAGGEAIFVPTDVSDPADAAALMQAALARFGRVDHAFNNAGVSTYTDDWDPGQMLRVLAVNLHGVMFGMQHQIAQMLAQGGGTIVNTASIAGLIGLRTSSHYVAAKHGVVGLTKSAAMEYAPDGIRVNCVNPGYVTTPMTKEAVETRGAEILAKVPMGRMGLPEEIAEAVVWMCSDKASFMTGAAQVVDGGYYAA